jgi:hypothetical protein
VEGELPPKPSAISVSSASAIVPGSPVLEKLKTDLEKARKDASEAEAREASLRKELDQLRDQLDQTLTSTGVEEEPKSRLREEELRFLRDQLDKARAEVESEARRRRETAATLAAKTNEHAEAIQGLHQKFAQIQLDHQGKVEAEARATAELATLRKEIERSRGELAEAKSAIDLIRFERERIIADHSRASDLSKSQITQLESRLVESEATRAHRDQLAGDLEGLQKRLAESERLIVEQKESLEALRVDRDRLEAARLEEIAELRDQLGKALASSADAAILRHDLDEVRADRERIHGEFETLLAKIAEAERREADWGYPSTEADLPAQADPAAEGPTLVEDQSTLFDHGAESLMREADELRSTLAELTGRLEEKDAELVELSERAKNEAKGLRRDLYDARLEAENASKEKGELAEQVRSLEAMMANSRDLAPQIDQASFDAKLRSAVDEAVKGAWADYERRLAETQARLKAANTRADLMEAEARNSHEQIAARERSLDAVGDGSSFGGEAASMTTIRILDARGTARLTPADAEARLELARQLAVDRKDKALIDRVAKMAQKVRGDLEARNYTLAETLVRGAEIETGLDPGGFSINGLRIFRASPTITGNLLALAPAFDRIMRDGELETIKTTIDEMKTILGDQAGLPKILRPGRTPTTKRPIARPEALRLFIDAIMITESSLVRAVVQKRPLPDTALGTYASLVEGACIARKVSETVDPDQTSFLEEIIQACCLMLTRRQQVDGHFAFLDPRGKACEAATVVDGMVAQRADAVKDGWVVHVDPIGMAQIETGPCAIALLTAGKALGRAEWTKAARKAAEWTVGQPCLPNFVANAASAGLVARSYLDNQEDPMLVGLVRKLSLGLLPAQAENGRWVDPQSATTSNHLLILRALLDAWEAMPLDRVEFRKELKRSIDLAMASLLEECRVLGVPAQGGTLRDLLRYRDLFPEAHDARIESAIVDSVTVIQELCHDGAKRKLGVPADQLAALMLV